MITCEASLDFILATLCCGPTLSGTAFDDVAAEASEQCARVSTALKIFEYAQSMFVSFLCRKDLSDPCSSNLSRREVFCRKV